MGWSHTGWSHALGWSNALSVTAGAEGGSCDVDADESFELLFNPLIKQFYHIYVFKFDLSLSFGNKMQRVTCKFCETRCSYRKFTRCPLHFIILSI